MDTTYLEVDQLPKRNHNVGRHLVNTPVKMYPAATDFEDAVLGALMINKNVPDLFMKYLSDEDFFEQKNCYVFKAIKSLYGNNSPIDIISVTREIRSMGVLEYIGGAYFITNLTNKVVGTHNLEYQCRILNQYRLKREMIRVCTKTINSLFSEEKDVFEEINELVNSTNRSVSSVTQCQYEHINDILFELIKIRETAPESTSYSTGYQSLDKLVGGIKRKNLWIIGGRPGMGKTSFALNMAHNISVVNKEPCGIISIEMTKHELVNRMLSIISNVDYQKIENNSLSNSELDVINKYTGILSNSNIYIMDKSSPNIDDIFATVMQLKNKCNVKAVFIDYIQLITTTHKVQSTYEKITDISKKLKKLAKDADICLIGLAQLNRESEKRNDKIPCLSDLKDSGQIEQDADIVTFLYRPEYYGIQEVNIKKSRVQDLHDGVISSEKIALAITEKNRSGRRGEVYLKFFGDTQKFSELTKTF